MPLNKGSTVALVTPFTSTGEIDEPNLKALLQMHIDADTDNLCILGTTGEASVMSMKERELILTTAVEMCKGKIPILAGCGTINPDHVKEMTQQAIDLGCDANLMVCPYYVKPPQRGLIQMFTSIADMGLPLIMYNIPGRASVNLSDESIVICSQHENIVGLKDATGDLSRLTSVRPLVGDDFLLYSGDDSSSLEFVKQGGDGCISVTANVAPAVMHQIMTHALKGDYEKAEALNEPLKMVHKQLFVESSPMPVKWALQRMGVIDTAYCRPPLDEMDPKFQPHVEEALKAAGLI
jgi:4-hydroxy-tetrahydrodipicolinate synthase